MEDVIEDRLYTVEEFLDDALDDIANLVFQNDALFKMIKEQNEKISALEFIIQHNIRR